MNLKKQTKKKTQKIQPKDIKKQGNSQKQKHEQLYMNNSGRFKFK